MHNILTDGGFEAVVFDFDGTLCDTAADIRSAWAETARKLGASPEESLRRYRIGPPLTELIKELIPGCDEEFQRRAVAVFGGIYDTSGFPETRPYPGIVELLAALNAAGTKLFIATNKRRRPMLLLLEKLRWTELFRALYTSDSTPGRRSKTEIVAALLEEHRIAPGSAAMVGDTAGDIRAGKDNAMTGIGVMWGYAPRAELEEAGADAVLNIRDLTEGVS